MLLTTLRSFAAIVVLTKPFQTIPLWDGYVTESVLVQPGSEQAAEIIASLHREE